MTGTRPACDTRFGSSKAARVFAALCFNSTCQVSSRLRRFDVFQHQSSQVRGHLSYLTRPNQPRLCGGSRLSTEAEVGWSNASQVFASYGLTLWADLRYSSTQLAAILSQYADQKIGESDRPNWLALGLGGDGKLVVVMHETCNDNTLAHVLLRRDRGT